MPLNHLADSARTHEVDLAPVVLGTIPAVVVVPGNVPVLADRAYDSDPLRESLAAGGFVLVAPHRRNRKKPATNDGRRMRRYKRRYVVERTFAWLHSFRGVITRFERSMARYDGLLELAFAFIALNKLL